MFFVFISQAFSCNPKSHDLCQEPTIYINHLPMLTVGKIHLDTLFPMKLQINT
jgi:hypothetical protein